MFILDIILLVVLAVGLIIGLVRGFILEVMGFVGVIIAVFVARIYAPILGEMVAKWFSLPLIYAKPIAYGLIFVAVVVACYLLAKMLNGIVKLVMLDWLNKLLGALFGLLKYVLILSVLINIFDAINHKFLLFSEEKTQQSVLYEPLGKILPDIMEVTDENSDVEHSEYLGSR